MKRFLLATSLFVSLFLTTNKNVFAQCNVGVDNNVVYTPGSGCNSAELRLGSGAYRDITLDANTIYNITFNANGSSTNGFSLTKQSGGTSSNGNISCGANTNNNWYVGTTNATVRISTNRTGGWNTNSAILTIRRVTPSGGSATISTPSSICVGGNIDLNTTGWANAISYSWAGPNSYSNGTQDPPQFATTTTNQGGTYTVTAANGACTATASVAVTVNNDPTFSSSNITATDNGIICIGGSSTLTASPSGGVGGYTYSWSGTGLSSTAIANPTATPTATGNSIYSVTVNSPANTGCDQRTGSYTITVNSDPVVTTPTVTNSSICKGGNTQFSGIASGGTSGPYTYTWSIPSGPNGFTQTQSGATVTPNTMSITVTQGSTATAQAYSYSYSVTQPQSGCASTASTVTQFTLFNDPVAPTATKSPNVTTVCAGQTLTLTNPQISVDGAGACVYEYQFSDDGGLNWRRFPDNASGLWGTTVPSFEATGSDNRIRIRRNCPNSGCNTSNFSEYTWTVNPDPIISSAVVLSQPDYCDNNNAAVLRATPSGGTGTPTFTWEWSPDGSSGWASLNAGTFNATVTPNNLTTPTLTASRYYRVKVDYDGADCDESSWRNIDVPVLIPDAPTSLQTLFTGCGNAVGSVNVSGSNTARWYLDEADAGSGNFDHEGTAKGEISPGTYTYYVTQYNPTTNCESQDYIQITIEVSPSFTINTNQTNVTCFNGSNGTATAIVNSPPPGDQYEYLWSNGSTTSFSTNTSNTISGLVSGIYNVQVNDNKGCVAFGSVTITQPSEVTVSGTITNVGCNGDATGSVIIVPAGGSGVYTGFNWSNGAATQNLTNVVAGTYTLNFSDNNGCPAAQQSYTVSQPSPLSLVANLSNICGPSGYTGATVNLVGVGGAGNYQFANSSNCSAASYNNTVTYNYGTGQNGTYSYCVNDANNCKASASVTITLIGSSVASTGTCDLIYVSNSGSGTLGVKDCPTNLVTALTLITPTRNTILMRNGDYDINQKIVLPADVTIIGGHTVDANGDWVQGTTTTTNLRITPTNAEEPYFATGHFIGIQATGNNFKLINLNVSVMPDGATGTTNNRGRSVYGIYMNSNVTTYEITRCNITAGRASDGVGRPSTTDPAWNGRAGSQGNFGTAGGKGNSSTVTILFVPTCFEGDAPGAGGAAGSAGSGGANATLIGGSAASGTAGGNGGSGSGDGNGGFSCTNGSSGQQGIGGGGSAGIGGARDSNNGDTPFGGNGGKGDDGSPGSNGTTIAATFSNNFYVPSYGTDGTAGTGGKGGGGGGGGGCDEDNCNGSGGGGSGGSGGSGGGGAGKGAFGGGASFAIFHTNSTYSPNLSQSSFSSNGAGNGGLGGLGGAGGASRDVTPRASGSACANGDGDCNRGGEGGAGGAGGDGGKGGDGGNGVFGQIYRLNVGPITNSGSVPSGSVAVNQSRGCTNSEIILIKDNASLSWNLDGGTLVRDNNANSSSYNNGLNSVKAFYTTLGVKNLQVGTNTYNRTVEIRQTRTLPTYNISYTPSGGSPTVVANTVADINAPLVLCRNQQVSLSVGGTHAAFEWKINGIDPNAGGTTATATHTFTNTGTFHIRLRLRDECCGWSIPIWATVQVVDVPTIATSLSRQNIPNPANPWGFCSGETTTITANGISGATSYIWTFPTGATASSFVTSSNQIVVTFGANGGNITVRGENNCGLGVQYSQAITINTSPSITLNSTPNPLRLCVSGTVEVSATLSSGTAPFNYSWSSTNNLIAQNNPPNTITSQSLSSNETFTVLVTDANSCTATASALVNIDNVTVGGAVTGGAPVCSGSTSPLLSLSGESGTVVRWESAVSPFISWQPIAHTATLYTSPALTETTQFRAVVKNGACANEFSTPTTVQVDQFTVADAGADQSQVCSPTYELQGNAPVSGNGVWSVLQGNGTFSNSNDNNSFVSDMNLGSNVYIWTLDNGACPSSESEVTIVKKDSSYLPNQIFALPNSICPGDEITLSLNGGVLGTNATWAWYSGSCGGTLLTNNTTISLNPSNDTWYYLRAEGDCNITDCMDAFVDVAIIPQVSWTGKINNDWRNPGNWCGLIPTITSEVLIPAGTPNEPIVYNGVVGVAKNVTVLSGATLDIQGGGKLCVNEPCASAYAGADVTVCAGDSYQLNGSAEGTAPLTYSWTPTTYLSNPNIPNPIVQNIPNIGSITYTFTVTDANGNVNSDDITISVTPQPSVADAGADFSICSGDITLNAAPITNGTGQWTLVSGSGNISSPNINSTNVTGLGFSQNTFRWTVTSGICPPDFDDITVTRDRIPVANAGSDINAACVGNTTPLNNGASANFGTPSWSIVNGGGSLSGANTLSPTYTPVAGDVNNSPIILALTVSSNNTCSTVVPTATDNMNINIEPLPIANAGSNAIICASGGFYTVNDALISNGLPSWEASASSGIPAGSLTDANSWTPTYTAGIGDAGKTITLTLTVTSNNSCNPAIATSSMNISVIAPPSVDAGNGATICAGSSHVFNSGDATASNFTSLNWTVSGNAGGTLSNLNSLTPTYESVASDGGKTITLTLNASGSGACSAVSVTDQMEITVQALPEGTISPTSSTICAGADYPVTGVSAQNGNILWAATNTAGGSLNTTNPLSPVYESVSAEGGRAITLTMTVSGNGVCSFEEDIETFTLNIDALPLASAGSNTSICATTSHVFSVNDASASNYSSVSWSASGNAGGTITNSNTLAPTYSSVAADAGKDITLTLIAQGTGACSSEESAPTSMVITVQQLPVANAGSDAVMCGDGVQTYFVNDATSSFGNILWTVPAGEGNIFNQTTLQPTFSPDPSVFGSNVTLTMTVTGTGVCSSFDEVDTKAITVNAPATAPNSITGVSSVCFGGSTTLTAIGGSEGSGAVYEWGTGTVGSNIISGATTNTYTTPNLNATTTYWVRRVGNSACTNTTSAATVTVTVDPLPIAILPTTSATICAGNTYNIVGVDAQNGTVSWNVSGNNGGTLNDANPLLPSYVSVSAEGGVTPIILTMTVSGSGSCSAFTDVETFTLTVNPLPTVNAGDDATICASTNHVLSAVADNYNTNSVQWELSANASNQNLINPNGLSPTYASLASDGGKVIDLEITVDGTGACSSESVSDVMQITIESLPNINAGADATICANTSYQVNDLTGSNYNVASIVWTATGNASGSSLSNSTSVMPTYNSVLGDAGNDVTLSVQVNGIGTCSSFIAGDSKLISVDFRPVAIAPADNTICAGTNYTVSGATALYGSIQWTVSASSGTPAGNLLNPNSINPIYESDVNDAGKTITLTLDVTSDNTCNPLFSSDAVNIVIDPLPVADAGTVSATNICAVTSFPVSGASALNGTYEWSVSSSIGSPAGTLSSTTAQNPSYQSAAADAGKTITLTLTVTSNNTCSPQTATDIVEITVDALPIANAGSVSTTDICEGESFTVSGASATNGTVLWSISGNALGTLSNETTLAPTYQSVAADAGNTITLTLTVTSDNSCGAATDVETITINVAAKPTVNAGIVSDVCEGNIVSLNATSNNYANITWSSDGDGNFNNTSILNPEYSHGSADVGNEIELSILVDGVGACSSETASSSVLVNIYQNPSITITVIGTPPDFFTISDPDVDLKTLATFSPSGGTFSGGTYVSPDGVFSPSTAGVGIHPVTYTITDSNGCSDSVTIEIEVTN